MKNWNSRLNEIDTVKSHKLNLKIVLEAFLTSDYANEKELRTDVIVLFNHLDKFPE
jgi:hypothetical protein